MKYMGFSIYFRFSLESLFFKVRCKESNEYLLKYGKRREDM